MAKQADKTPEGEKPKPHRQPRAAAKPAPAAEGKSEQKALLDQSSGINRNLGLVFVSFLMYVLITVAGISDLQLLLDDKPIELPILGVGLPVYTFAYITPIVILGVHLNLLLNLLEHSRKLHRWIYGEDESYETIEDLNLSNHFKKMREQMHPFLFNYTGFKDKLSIAHRITNILVDSITYFFSLGALYYLEWRFADYHDWLLTSEQLFILLLDGFLVFYFFPLLRRPHVYGKERLGWLRGHFERGFLSFIPNQIQSYLFHLRPLQELFELHRFIRRTVYKFCFYGILGLGIWNAVIVFEIVRNSYGLEFYNLWPQPRIDVSEKTLARKLPSPEVLQQAIQNGWSEDSALMHYTDGIDLANRDLQFANFNNSSLIKANLKGANLKFTNLNHANMQGAHLWSTDLQGASLEQADLKFSELINAILIGVYLDKADLRKADLMGAQLQWSHLSWAILDEAKLTSANLQKSILYGVSLKLSNLEGANLTHSNLEKADLRFAKISGGNIAGAYISRDSLAKAKIDFIPFHKQPIWIE